MSKIKISDRIKINDQEDYFIVENDFSDDGLEEDTKAKRLANSLMKLRIRAFRKPAKTSTIVLVENDEYVGHISANLYEDNVASLTMSGVRGIQLPDKLGKFIDVIKKHDVALFVDEAHRNQGKAKQMLMLMFKYLVSQGINDLEVYGIASEEAYQTYIHTGAEAVDVEKVVYRNIKKFIKNERIDDIEK